MACFHYFSSHSRKRRAGTLPPGPYPWPIVGNIFQVGRNPHRSLANLSKTFGPIMTLKLGNSDAIVVSSPELAKEILQKHDRALSGRFSPAVMQAHDHHKFSVGILSVGKEWRKYRRICKEKLFSTLRLDASHGLREKNLQRLSDYVQKCCDSSREVNIYDAVFVTLHNLVSATLFSAELSTYESDGYQEYQRTVKDFFRCLGTPNIADVFPILQPLDPQGLKRKMTDYLGKLLALFEDMINQRLKSRGTSLGGTYQKKNDLLETLLDLSEGSEYELTTNEIKHFIMDLILAGTETTTIATEWIMTELLLHPEILKKVKHELRTVVGENKQIQESDIPRLPYFEAVIKEVFRLHPPGPFLFPHKAECDVEVSGYMIPKGAKVFVNAWAIGRDPSPWPNPDSFEPERFLDRKIDINGQDFELIPFGSGRRICPALPLVNRMVPCMVATLIHNFDWKFEASAEAKQVQREEVFGVTLKKRVSLKVIPIKSQA